MTDDAPVDHVEQAREQLRVTLEHIERMDGSGVWGLWALVVGLLLKAVLWQVDRKTEPPSASDSESTSNPYFTEEDAGTDPDGDDVAGGGGE